MKKILHKISYNQQTKRHWYIAVILVLVLTSVAFIDTMIKNGLNMSSFKKHSINTHLKEELIAKNVWNVNCPIDISRLRLLTISYYNFSGKEVTDGKMIVLDIVADRVLNIFKTLHKNKFPIANMKLLTEYRGDDNLSMQDNNTSGFNCRKIFNGEELSTHSYGVAIDFNPLQNPYIDNDFELGKVATKILPPEGMEYLNRTLLKPGMVENPVDPENPDYKVTDLFYENGFRTWGGQWAFPVDWQHFQVEKEFIKRILSISPEEGAILFESVTKNPNPKTQTLKTQD
jgi:hypothetical protein